MEAISPIIAGTEEFTIELAKNQPEYNTLPCLLMEDPIRVVTRWRLSATELTAILNGGDIFLETLTFGKPFQPVRLSVITSEDVIVD